MRRAEIRLQAEAAELHMRPCRLLGEAVRGLDCRLSFHRSGRGLAIDAEFPTIDISTAVADLGIRAGVSFAVECDGPDENQAFEGLKAVFESNLLPGTSFSEVHGKADMTHEDEQMPPDVSTGLQVTGTAQPASRRQPKILVVEDELAHTDDIPRRFDREGYRATAVARPEQALVIIKAAERIDFAVIDMKLPITECPEMSALETQGGESAGLVIADELRRRFPRTPIVFWTSSRGRKIRTGIRKLGNAQLIPKAAGFEPVVEVAREYLDGIGTGTRPRSFIVHGHDTAAVRSVKEFVVNHLHFPPPIVLLRESTHLDTVIEKIENHTHEPDIVFVLLTPDDEVIPSRADGERVYRARQNVILELGYFLGVFGRMSGRIVLLVRQPVELPSDIGGMVPIDISRGIESAGREIENEVREWLHL